MKKARIILAVIFVLSLIGGWRYWSIQRKQEDTTDPVLSASPDVIEMSIDATDEELLEGVSAYDDQDGDVSDSIIIESVSKITDGATEEFEITYVAFDSSGNVGRLTRSLIYTDYSHPHFEISRQLRFAQNSTWSLLDYIVATDCLDGNLSPFVTIEGSEDIQSDSPTGTYKCTLSVTNSVGDTAQVPIQVEIYEDSEEEQLYRPSITLSTYLTYIELGAGFDPENYLYRLTDGIEYQIDFGEMIENETADGIEWVTEKEADGENGDWINVSEITITSEVDTSTEGTYFVLYTYTSERTGYDCRARLIVVVED
ncbi:MAG: hypothetical protein LUF35_11025 [Lachnospiraceae bacterium]|nr:hypothetical protein [Lachnospiraceae bacterium]